MKINRVVMWIFDKFLSASPTDAEPTVIDDIVKVTLDFDFDDKINDDDEDIFNDMNIYLNKNDRININSTPKNGNFIQNSY